MKRNLLTSGADQEAVEDFEIAMNLLNKYKQDKQFIQKELKSQKQKVELIGVVEAKAKSLVLNPVLTQEERHKAIKEKRERRKQLQMSS